jgi:flagellar motor component MotA
VRDETNIRQLTLVGVLAIQEGMNPKLVRERLSSFVHDHGDAKAPAAAAAAAPASA